MCRRTRIWAHVFVVALILFPLACVKEAPAQDKREDTSEPPADTQGGDSRSPPGGAVITGSGIHPQQDLPRPATGVPIVVPIFGGTMVRITDSKQLGMQGVFPEYSKRQAWNADESRFLLRNGDGDALLFDAKTRVLDKKLLGIGGDDVFWHPSEPQTIIYSADHAINRISTAGGEPTTLLSFPEYAFVSTRGEGNLSADGRRHAVVGQTYNDRTGEVGMAEYLLLDLSNQTVLARLKPAIKVENFDWISVSPSGKFVVVDYADDTDERWHGLEVYDENFQLVWRKPLGAGHSDLAVDTDGSDVLVMDGYDAETNQTWIRKYRLADGTMTHLLWIAPLFDQHISCRNLLRPGWCYISTFDYLERLTDSRESWLPYEDEIFALRLDGSGTTERLGHHYSRRYGPGASDSDLSQYFAEPHATVNRDGTQILFGSNWRQDIKSADSIDAYVLMPARP